MDETEKLQSSYLLLRFLAYKAIRQIEAGDAQRAAEQLKKGIAETERDLGLEPIGTTTY